MELTITWAMRRYLWDGYLALKSQDGFFSFSGWRVIFINGGNHRRALVLRLGRIQIQFTWPHK